MSSLNTCLPLAGTEIPCYAFESHQTLARELAQVVAAIIHERRPREKAVLGLPTGSTPVGMYRELIRMHRAGKLDLSNVVTFNLDEYHGLAPDRLQSYHRWMFETLFRPRQHPAREHPHSRRPGAARPSERPLPAVRAGDPRRRGASTFNFWGSAATGTSVSTSPFRRG